MWRMRSFGLLKRMSSRKKKRKSRRSDRSKPPTPTLPHKGGGDFSFKVLSFYKSQFLRPSCQHEGWRGGRAPAARAVGYPQRQDPEAPGPHSKNCTLINKPYCNIDLKSIANCCRFRRFRK